MNGQNTTFIPKNSYELSELVECGYGNLFGPRNAKLPVKNMLMLDRISTIESTGGNHGRGHVIAELDINPDLWFFECHFPGDPVMPGCLGLDALCSWSDFSLLGGDTLEKAGLWALAKLNLLAKLGLTLKRSPMNFR